LNRDAPQQAHRQPYALRSGLAHHPIMPTHSERNSGRGALRLAGHPSLDRASR
jgi:hypothetical protein